MQYIIEVSAYSGFSSRLFQLMIEKSYEKSWPQRKSERTFEPWDFSQGIRGVKW